MIAEETKYTFADGVYYSKIGDQVFARNVLTHYEYLYDGCAWEIFLCIQAGMTFVQIINKIMAEYDVASKKLAISLIEPFLQRLEATGIIRVVGGGALGASSPNQPSITDRVEQYCFNHKRLWNATLELTYRCNERCRHCYLDAPDEVSASNELSTSEYERVIDELHSLGCMKILVTGGEPTLRNDFLDICRFVTSRGMLLDVFTNALKIPESCFNNLIQMKVNSISFSLYSGSAEFHDYVTQIKGSFDATLRNVLAFKSAGVDVYVKTVLFSGHFSEFKQLRDLCKLYRIRLTVSQFVIPGHSGKKLNTLAFSADEYQQFVELELSDPMPDADEKISLLRDMDSPICQAGHTIVSIDPRGNVYPCNSVPVVLGNVRESSLAYIWNESNEIKRIRALKFGNVSDRCHSCKYSGLCVFCLGAAMREHDGELKPCATSCRNSKIRYDIYKKCQKLT